MIAPRALVLAALVPALLALASLELAGCAVRGGAPAASPAQTSSAAYGPPPTSFERETVTPGASTAGGASAGGYSISAPPSAQVYSLPGRAPAATPDSGGVAPEEERDARIAQWEVEIARQRTVLGGSLTQCRDVCAAAANVCTAAFEICRLTGDVASSEARDPRCARARGHCLDAGRRRDGHCPVCPAR